MKIHMAPILENRCEGFTLLQPHPAVHGMNRIPLLLAFLAVPMLSVAAPPTPAEFSKLADRSACEQPAPGKVVFAGDILSLGTCLELAPREIHELRISSGGGMLSDAVKIAQKYRFDHVVVDGLCVGGCASFILPAAKRITVREHSYVLLQRGSNARVLDEERARLVAEFHNRLPDATDAEINGSIDWLREKALADAPAYEAFAKQALACDDWLDPTAPPERALPLTAWNLVVTPEMARRCLKKTKIESFWAPEAQDKYAPELGFFRARR
jgi:hypothetical protein